jgi:hypothetical protein
MLPGYSEYREEQKRALDNQLKRLMDLWQGGLTGERLFTARMLIFCGLPVSEHKGPNPVVRKAQLADRSWLQVSFIQTHKQVPLPFRADRTMAYFLTNKAALQQSPILRWEYANEYMHLFGMDPNSGKNYRDVQARFTRIAYMDIMVEHSDVNGKVIEHWKCPMIDHARISAEVDGEGNWKPSQSVANLERRIDRNHLGYRNLKSRDRHGLEVRRRKRQRISCRRHTGEKVIPSAVGHRDTLHVRVHRF